MVKANIRKIVLRSMITFVIIIFVLLITNLSSYFGIFRIGIANEDPNSMYPMFYQGDQILVQKVSPGKINVGDLIVFESGTGEQNVFHRVQDVMIIIDTDSIESYYFRTKGDNTNNTYIDEDPLYGTLTPYERVIGKVIYVFPHGIGKMISSLSDTIMKVVFILLVMMTYFGIKNMSRIDLGKLNLQNPSQKKLILSGSLILLVMLSNLMAAGFLEEDGAENNINISRISEGIYASDYVDGDDKIFVYYTVVLRVQIKNIQFVRHEISISIIELSLQNQTIATNNMPLRENSGGILEISITLVIHNENIPARSKDLYIKAELLSNHLFYNEINYYETFVSFQKI